VELDFVSIASAALVTLTGLLLLISRNWRVSIALLTLQYLGVVQLIAGSWPLSMAITRLVAGWMAGAMLGMAMLSMPAPRSQASDPGGKSGIALRGRPLVNPLFYLLAALLVGLIVAAQLVRVMTWIPALSLPQAWAGLVLIGLGLLRLSFSDQALFIALGLLTLNAGFEILYTALSAAPLAAGLSAAVTLGLGLAGAYLLLAPHMEPNE
jgi:hypothetical protein